MIQQAARHTSVLPRHKAKGKTNYNAFMETKETGAFKITRDDGGDIANILG